MDENILINETIKSQNYNEDKILEKNDTNLNNSLKADINKNEILNNSNDFEKQKIFNDNEFSIKNEETDSTNLEKSHYETYNFIDNTDKNLVNQSSEPYTDFGGINLEEFLFDALRKNTKDRIYLLKIEQELINLVKDEQRNSLKFPPMTSYHRMLVHRVAAYFGLDHNIDTKGNCVIVNKQKGITRIPELKFKDQIKQLSSDEPKKSILKRNTSSLDENILIEKNKDFKLMNLDNTVDSRRSKSFEEREEQYEKARARIFNQSKNESNCFSIDSKDFDSDKVLDFDTEIIINSENKLIKSYEDKIEDSKNIITKQNEKKNYFDSNHSSSSSSTIINPNLDIYNEDLNDSKKNNFSKDVKNFKINKQEKITSKENNLKSINSSNLQKIDKTNKNFYKNKKIVKNSSYPNNLHSIPSLVSPIDQQAYPNWIPDSNAQDCHKQMYQHYNYSDRIPLHDQQKLYLLCNFPETNSYSNDKIMPNPIILPSTNLNQFPMNGNIQNKDNLLNKEDLNSCVTAHLSNLSITSLNHDIPEANRTSNVPYCYVKSPFYPISGPNTVASSDIIYQNNTISRSDLSNQNQSGQMVLIPNFNNNMNNFNRPNSLLPVPQAVAATNNQRYSNQNNYNYAMSCTTSQLKVNSLYTQTSPPYLFTNSSIRPQQSPLLPTPVISVIPTPLIRPKENQNDQGNNLKKKMNGFKNEKIENKNLNIRQKNNGEKYINSNCI